LGLLRASQGLLVGILVGLVQGDAAIGIEIGRTPQSGDEVVGEERSTQAIGFLRDFVRRAGGQKGNTAHKVGRVHHEGRPPLAAFGPDESTGGARIQDGDAHVGVDGRDVGFQIGVGEDLPLQKQTFFVGVTGIVDENLDVLAICTGQGHPMRHLIQRLFQAGHVGLLNHDGVFSLNAAQA
jgi:hypothetical protein